jgi:DNA-binding PadR family transcriptional regulator
MPAGPAPLTPISLAILLALADSDRHGYAILKEVERQSDGQLRIGTGSLYAALQRLVEEAAIEDLPEARGPDEDARRRYYRLTPTGRERAKAELVRMARAVEEARSKKLLPTPSALNLGGAS